MFMYFLSTVQAAVIRLYTTLHHRAFSPPAGQRASPSRPRAACGAGR